jgi:hypothetical protein
VQMYRAPEDGANLEPVEQMDQGGHGDPNGINSRWSVDVAIPEVDMVGAEISAIKGLAGKDICIWS